MVVVVDVVAVVDDVAVVRNLEHQNSIVVDIGVEVGAVAVVVAAVDVGVVGAQFFHSLDNADAVDDDFVVVDSDHHIYVVVDVDIVDFEIVVDFDIVVDFEIVVDVEVLIFHPYSDVAAADDFDIVVDVVDVEAKFVHSLDDNAVVDGVVVGDFDIVVAVVVHVEMNQPNK